MTDGRSADQLTRVRRQGVDLQMTANATCVFRLRDRTLNQLDPNGLRARRTSWSGCAVSMAPEVLSCRWAAPDTPDTVSLSLRRMRRDWWRRWGYMLSPIPAHGGRLMRPRTPKRLGFMHDTPLRYFRGCRHRQLHGRLRGKQAAQSQRSSSGP